VATSAESFFIPPTIGGKKFACLWVRKSFPPSKNLCVLNVKSSFVCSSCGHRVSVSKEKGLQKLLLSLLSFPESEHSVCLKKGSKAEKGKHSMVKKSWNAISRKRDQTMPVNDREEKKSLVEMLALG